jgi:hypothetical protein
MDVLILAAGLSSRLSNYTHDIIPKYLINLDTHNGLYYIIHYWQKYAHNIFLVIHSKYNIITKFYIDNILTDYKNKIIIINYDSSDGTAYTLSYILNTKLIYYDIKNLLITWCDIYPNENIKFETIKKSSIKNNIYIFTYGNQCRYKLNNNIIEESNNGNIIGIYYFQNYKRFMLDENSLNKDIVLYLKSIGNIFNYSLNNIIDYGDENKLLYIINNPCKKTFTSRYFNSLQLINNDMLLKKSIDEKGNDIIFNEKNWYKYVNNIEHIYIPKIYKYYQYGFLMEYKKDYIPLYQYFIDFTPETNIKNMILDNIFDKLKILHSFECKIQNKTIFYNDLKKEINDKIIDRKKKIEPILNYFGEIEYVNNIKILSFENIIENCKNIITKYYEENNKYIYNIILGDCNFSNILIKKDDINTIVFIDPRGYYGNTKIHGIIEYDISKILYGISGYDKFNAKYFNIESINIEKKSLKFTIDSINFDKEYIDKYFNKVHYAFMIIHWLSLAEYNKNNIWKCIASYYHGLYLGTLSFS